MKFLILNGPNLNLQGRRDTAVYGTESFESLLTGLRERFSEHEIAYLQSNVEGELIDALQASEDCYDGVVFNAGGYTHTSVALRDAVEAISTPVVEVHISNIAAREPFRHTSLLTPVCRGAILGFGLKGYWLAIESLIEQ